LLELALSGNPPPFQTLNKNFQNEQTKHAHPGLNLIFFCPEKYAFKLKFIKLQKQTHEFYNL
jgi:hypothetical protein